MKEFLIGKTRLVFLLGDITRQDTDAIVNAANTSLLGGGGVDGAIHRAGGPKILAECRKIIAGIGSLPAGEAVITTGGNLAAKYVIHTVGPIWRDGNNGEKEVLKNAYLNSLKTAVENNIKSISFPSISTGAYRFPVELAAMIAVSAIKEFAEKRDGMDEISFVLFSESDLRAYVSQASKIFDATA